MTLKNGRITADQVDFIEFIDMTLDLAWYRTRYQDVADLNDDALLAHFLRYGMKEGRSPNSAFDFSDFRRLNSSIIGEDDPANLYQYFLMYRTNLLHPSYLFDVNWYYLQLERNGAFCREPTNHYRTIGWKQGYTPHPLFDQNFYLDVNHITLPPGLDPLGHYHLFGSKEKLQASQNFEPSWYKNQNGDVAEAGIDPLWHYLVHGHLEGRAPTSYFLARDRIDLLRTGRKEYPDPLSKLLFAGKFYPDRLPNGTRFEPRLGLYDDPASVSKLSCTPLVSVIIANKNGSGHLRDVIASLANQSYENFEILLVDDGSSDDSVDIARELNVDTIIETDGHLGFAGANNVGQRRARGELLVLLNNDARVETGWLHSLVTRVQSDNMIGAVTSKVRFWCRFVNVTVSAKSPFSVDVADLLDSLTYKKLFVRFGSEIGELIQSQRDHHGNYRVAFDLPSERRLLRVPVKGLETTYVAVAINYIDVLFDMVATDSGHYITISAETLTMPIHQGFYLINNAGSVSSSDGLPADRGFGEPDLGQFEHTEDVDFICGCSVLVRRDALRGKLLFVEELFAYFEDSELSNRLRGDGYRLVYEPASVAYHKHSATSVERSVFWRKQTMRNEIIFRYIVSRDPAVVVEGLSRLNHLKHWYQSQTDATAAEIGFASEVPSMCLEIHDITQKFDNREVPRRAGFRIGVYNPYWTTLGGGEAHALYVAEVLAELGTVELMSTSDFDLDWLGGYFGCNTSGMIKRLIDRLNPAITAHYDIFVNACFRDSTASYARKSYYIVSFPHEGVPKSFTGSYRFLCNSRFTRNWLSKMWGDVSSDVVYPLVHDAFFGGQKDNIKQKVFLTVGRFASGGHIKNQIEIAEAFKAFERRRGTADWKLVLIGSVNDPDYLRRVREALVGTNSAVITNADFGSLVEAYQVAAVYVHASGFGRDPEEEPHLQEHFGMAVAQGVASGCIPVVYDSGGPAEILKESGVGVTFGSLDELTAALERAVYYFENPDRYGMAPKEIAAKAGVFGRRAFRSKVLSVFEH